MIKKVRFFCLPFILFFFVPVFFTACSPEEHSIDFWAMDTYCEVTVYGGDCSSAENAVEQTEILLRDSGGDSNTLFAYEKKEFEVPYDISNAVNLSLDISYKTGGLFDITIAPLSLLWDVSNRTAPPTENEIEEAKALVGYEKLTVSGNKIIFSDYDMGIDIGAIGKGLAANKAVEALKKDGVEEAVVNLGGNVSVIGNKNGEGYKIGIRNPFSSGIAGYVTVSDTSVVTSGSYERNFIYEGKLYHHILNPFTGYPFENGLVSATVICDDSLVADSLSTAFFAVGEEGAKTLLEECSNYNIKGVILISESGRISLLGGAGELFTLTGEGFSLEK